MTPEIKILSSIAESNEANNHLLLDIADFCESIKNTLEERSDVSGGAVNVNRFQNKVSSNPEADVAADAVNSILTNASKLKNLRNVGNIGTMISGIGRGLKEFIDVIKLGGPTLRLNQGAMDSLADSINYFTNKINATNDAAKKNDTIALFKNIGSGVKGFSENMWSAALKLKTGKLAISWIVDGLNHFAEKINNATSLTRASGDTRYGKSMLESMLGTISTSVHNFSSNLWTSAIKLKTGKIAIIWIAESINLLSEKLEKSEKTISGIESLGLAGSGILKFATLTMLAMPMLVLAVPSLLLLGAALFTFNTVMKLYDEKSMKSIGTLNKIGLSILVFSGSLALSAIILSATVAGAGLLGLGVLFGSLAILGLTFKLFGDQFSQMGKGALGLGVLSLSLVAFSMSLAISSALISNVGIMNALGLLAAVAGFAVVFGIAGQFAMPIALGSLAMLAVGVSLLVLSHGIESLFKASEGHSFLDYIGQAGLLLGLVGVYSLAGAAFPVIALGGAAMGIMGASLWALGQGLKTVMSTKINSDQAKEFASAASELTGIFDSIGPIDMVTIPLKLPAVMAIGAGLMIMAKGIKEWKTLDLTSKDMEEVATKVAMILTTIPSIFSQIGEKDRGSGTPISLFGKIFGNDFSKGDVERGISSTMKLGENLKNLADGVIAWKTMKITEADVNMIQKNVGMVLGVLPSVFADVGKADAEGEKGSIMKSIFGSDFSQGNIDKGIERANQFSKLLKPLAEGIRAWGPGGKEAITPQLIDQIRLNVESLMAVLPGTFAKIGAQDKETDGTWWWSDSDMERGVELANDLVPIFTKIGSMISSLKDINAKDKGMEIGLGFSAMFGSLIAFVSKMSGKEKQTNLTISLFDVINKGFGKFGDNITRTNKLMKELITYVDPLQKLATSFVVMTVSIERQVKAINSVSLANLAAYGQLYANMTAAVTAKALSSDYKLGITGWDYKQLPTVDTAGARPVIQQQAPIQTQGREKPQVSYRPSIQNDQKITEVLENLTSVVSSMMGGVNLSNESATRIGNVIADAMINYMRSNRSFGI